VAEIVKRKSLREGSARTAAEVAGSIPVASTQPISGARHYEESWFGFALLYLRTDLAILQWPFSAQTTQRTFLQDF
jgi:hypothetical protein